MTTSTTCEPLEASSSSWPGSHSPNKHYCCSETLLRSLKIYFHIKMWPIYTFSGYQLYMHTCRNTCTCICTHMDPHTHTQSTHSLAVCPLQGHYDHDCLLSRMDFPRKKHLSCCLAPCCVWYLGLGTEARNSWVFSHKDKGWNSWEDQGS